MLTELGARMGRKVMTSKEEEEEESSINGIKF